MWEVAPKLRYTVYIPSIWITTATAIASGDDYFSTAVVLTFCNMLGDYIRWASPPDWPVKVVDLRPIPIITHACRPMSTVPRGPNLACRITRLNQPVNCHYSLHTNITSCRSLQVFKNVYKLHIITFGHSL